MTRVGQVYEFNMTNDWSSTLLVLVLRKEPNGYWLVVMLDHPAALLTVPLRSAKWRLF